ncbi:MAG: hypothetical protein FJ399_06225, partial [Verrucomicrobia bacterium]|nr:hypothetical protein [Verrucomicrobiota bacterium]
MKHPTPARTLAMLIGMLGALVVTSVATAQEAGPPRATTREEWQRVLESQKARVAYSWAMRGMIEATWAHRPVAEVYSYVFTEGTGLALDMVTGGPPAVGASV